MKKILGIVSAVVIAVVIFGAGFVFAQSNVAQAAGLPAGYGPGSMNGGMGGRGSMVQMHEYVEQALADKLGIAKADVETALDSGKTMYQLAIDKGIKAADVTTLLTEVHKTAFAKAVADGVLTQAQADLMLQNMTANGFTGIPMQNGAGMMRGNRGGGRGQGGMMGNWNQVQPTTVP
ncbi:MAG: hypothetical protein WCK35_22435 [Chloroflexota bacterium]